MSLNRSSQKFTEDFIDVYRRNKCLWQLKHVNYNNSRKRRVAYEELRRLCEKEGQSYTIEFVKAKINNVKTAFRKEYRKMQRLHLNGAPLETYQPSLFYFHSMMFTVDQEDPCESESTALPLNDSSDLWNDEQVFQESWSLVQNSPIDQANKKRKEDFEGDVGHSAHSDSSYPAATSNFRERPADDSKEFDAVGLNVAAKLKKMSSSQQIYAELVINKVLAKGLLNKLTEETDLSEF